MPELTAEEEVDRNYVVFRQHFTELMTTVPGKFVVLHGERIIESFDTFADAMTFGRNIYGRGHFSVQEVTDRPISLGYRHYAMRQRSD